ncbi:MAG: GtrA family protein [Hungatella sp.]
MISKIWNKLVNREAITYIIFGILTTLVDWVVYAVLWRIGTDYRISTALSWCAAVLFAFITNKLFVFQSFDIHLRYLWKEFVSFVTCRAATGVFTFVAMIVMVDALHLHEFIGKLIVSAISLVLNYILSKLFIFKKNQSSEEERYGA